MPDGCVEQNHRSGFAASQGLMGMLRARVGHAGFRKVNPFVRPCNEAGCSVLLTKRIDHQNKSQHWRILRYSRQIGMEGLCWCSCPQSSREKELNLKGSPTKCWQTSNR